MVYKKNGRVVLNNGNMLNVQKNAVAYLESPIDPAGTLS